MIGRKITGSAQHQKSKENAKSSMRDVIQIYQSRKKRAITPQLTQGREVFDMMALNP